MPSLFAIGDIHGHFNLLEKLIQKLNPNKSVTLIFLGDYIDRGPDSKKVVEFLIALSQKVPCVFLKGNHENMLEKAQRRDSEAIKLWLWNGGTETIKSYNGFDEIYSLHASFYSQLKWYYETEEYIFVHAGVRPEYSLSEQTHEDLVWIREDFIFSPSPFSKKIIFGHTPFKKPFVSADKIGIDTGAAYGGPLTAIQLPEETFVSVIG